MGRLGSRMKQLHNIQANSANTLLVVVDVQNDFSKVGGNLGPGGVVTEELARSMAETIAVIGGLAKRARSSGARVMYIQSVRTFKEPEFTVFNYPHMLELGSWGSEIVDELEPQKDDVVIQKFSHDPFYNTNIDQVLESLVPDPTKHQVIVTGGAAHVCAYHAAMGFHLRNYWTIVPIDALFGGDEGMRFALEQFSLNAYPNIFLTRSNLVEFSEVPEVGVHNLVPDT